jgi:hypothetical protein
MHTITGKNAGLQVTFPTRKIGNEQRALCETASRPAKQHSRTECVTVQYATFLRKLRLQSPSLSLDGPHPTGTVRRCVDGRADDH